MQRYFIETKQINNNIITIKGNDVHHIKTVMRMNINEKIIVCDEVDTYLCKITFIGNEVEAEIINKINENVELNINITIAHGLVRREKMEEVIRRLVELGCNSYIPVDMRRSVVKHKEINIERLNKIVKEASEQSQRTKLMNLSDVISFNDLLKQISNFDLVLFAHTIYKENNFLYELLVNNYDVHKYNNILVIVGPEGGFDDGEVEKILKFTNVRPIGLGKRILRTETAPLYIMSVLGFLGEKYDN